VRGARLFGLRQFESFGEGFGQCLSPPRFIHMVFPYPSMHGLPAPLSTSQEERNGHHPFRGHGTGRARPVADFAEAAEDEDQAQQNPREQRESGFNSGVHVYPFLIQFLADHFVFESNITNTSW
jgi:hypothetical protein